MQTHKLEVVKLEVWSPGVAGPRGGINPVQMKEEITISLCASTV
jgi:hypothetical protein